MVVVAVMVCCGHYCDTGGHCGDVAVAVCNHCYDTGGHCGGNCGLYCDTGGHQHAVLHRSSGILSCTAVMNDGAAETAAAAVFCAAAD